MYSLLFSEDQTIKTLKMLNKLTKYKFKPGMIPGYLCFTDKKGKTDLIHIMEATMFWLPELIQEALPDKLVLRKQPRYVGNVRRWREGDTWTLYSEFWFHFPKKMKLSEHPVDWLYKEFKKIK